LQNFQGLVVIDEAYIDFSKRQLDQWIRWIPIWLLRKRSQKHTV
jgi:histidinol-phosphate/aromatic aminotransferase/cobyric acid decarboxylase-like protein